MVIAIILNVIQIYADDENDYADGGENVQRITLNRALVMIERRRLSECVARTICELSCDPDGKLKNSFNQLRIYSYVQMFRSWTHR